MISRPISIAAAFAAALLTSSAFGQAAPAAPAAPARPLGPTAFPTGPGAWIAPPGTSVSINPETGVASYALPIQPVDGSSEQKARFAAWAKHPYAGTGPYASTRDEPADAPKHTLYFPADMKKAPKMPVVLWANGGCRNTSVEFTRFLGEIASRGYIVAAIGRSEIPFLVVGGAGQPTAAPDGRPLQVREPLDLIAGLDYLTKENARSGSRFYGKVDVTKVAALGQSCGGAQAFNAAKDTRIKAVATLNSGFPARATNATLTYAAEDLKIPAAMFTGGPGDSAYRNAPNVFKAMPGAAPTVQVDMPSMGHTGAYPMPDTRWTQVVVGWLDWSLKGDAKAKDMFVGANCSLCKDSDFWVKTKGVN